VNAKALSVDVGPAVIANMAAIYKDEAKVNELTLQLQSKRYDVLSSLTMACLKAAQNDNTIDLSSTFSGDVKRMNLLNDQLGLALGVRSVVELADASGKSIKKIGYSKAVAKFFPQAGAKKDDPTNTQKATLRTNYLHQLKKAAQAACAIIEKGMTVKSDTKAGTLMISGPAVVEAFGSDNVLLNEKQKVQTDKGEVTLKAKPSFTALKDIGAASQPGAAPKKPTPPAGPALDPDLAVQSLCSSLVSAIAKLKATPNEKTRTAFKSVQSAIDKVTKAA
jgi:hypothetical protein